MQSYYIFHSRHAAFLAEVVDFQKCSTVDNGKSETRSQEERVQRIVLIMT